MSNFPSSGKFNGSNLFDIEFIFIFAKISLSLFSLRKRDNFYFSGMVSKASVILKEDSIATLSIRKVVIFA